MTDEWNADSGDGTGGFRRSLLDLETPPETDLRDLYTFWQSVAETEGIPSRKWFSAESLRKFLPRILIVQVNEDGASFSYRLAGSQVYEVHGYEFTGRNVDEIQPAGLAAALREDFEWIVSTRLPQLAELVYSNSQGEERRYLMLRLPLSEDGVTVSQILICGDYSSYPSVGPSVTLAEFLRQ